MTTTEPLTSRALRDLDELRSALLAEGAARADDAVVDLGLARVDPARSGPATGAFVVDTGGRRLGDEPVRPLHLSAAAEGAPRFAVIDVIAWEGNQLLIEAELTVDEVAALAESGSRPLHLFAAARPASTARALHDRLGDGSDLGLAATLLERSSPAGPDPASAALADRGAPGAGAAIATDADADADRRRAHAHDAAVADPGAAAGPDVDAARGVRATRGIPRPCPSNWVSSSVRRAVANRRSSGPSSSWPTPIARCWWSRPIRPPSTAWWSPPTGRSAVARRATWCGSACPAPAGWGASPG